MNKDTIFIHILDLLNEAVECDDAAMANLIRQRVYANNELADHPTIQVIGDEAPLLGMLGIVNGITERLTGNRVAAVYDDKTNELLRFDKWSEPEDV